MTHLRHFFITACFVSACAKPPSPAPVVARHTPKPFVPFTSQTSAAPVENAPIDVAEEPAAPLDPRCELLRRENERKVREFAASLKDPDPEIISQLLAALSPCLPGRQAAWGLSFAWPRPPMAKFDLFPPRGMHPDAWDEYLKLQIVRVSNDGDFQRACISVNAVGPRDCSLAVSAQALQSDRTAVPALVFEDIFQIEQVADFDDDGDDELVVRKGFCLYTCSRWFEVWSLSGRHLTAFGPTQTMNIVAIKDFDGDGKVDVATRAGFVQICHEKSAKDGTIQDECFGPKKAAPALVRRNLGGGRFAPPSVEVKMDTSETDTSDMDTWGRPDPRGFKF